jgi:3-oxosteroid 1-dehydrogenase
VSWHSEFDLVIVGSGAAGMACALRAHDLGASVVVLEKSPHYGGSTAMSGGVVWVPDNPQMKTRGVSDSPEESLTYLREITEGQVPEARIQAYVDNAKRVLAYFEEHSHLRLDSLEKYTDYYPERPGGKPGGRSMEPIPFDASVLGEQFELLRKPHPQSQVLGKFGISAREAHKYLVNSLSSKMLLFWRLVQYGLRWPSRRGFSRDTRLFAGNSLIARLRRSLMDRDVPVWLGVGAEDLVIDHGEVTGVVTDDGRRLRARKGVLLGAGGFESNAQMRGQHQPAITSTTWTAANPYSQGKGIELGRAAGGAVDFMHDAWWTPTTKVPKSDLAWVLVVEKNLPGGFFVDAGGKRFTNEAAPYLDVVKGMLANDAVVGHEGGPGCWLVFDAEFRHLYPVGPVAPGYAQPDSRISRRLREGFLKRGKSLEELADAIHVPREAFLATIERFNEQADRGKDEDFGRGDSAADRYYGDPRVQPNPCMRALRKGPFYAIPVFAGDLGTKGGLVTDASARVLDADNNPIPGLFAAGNTSSAVMGPSYPGAGGTIGPALTFGFIAAETACPS